MLPTVATRKISISVFKRRDYLPQWLLNWALYFQAEIPDSSTAADEDHRFFLVS